MNETRQPQYMTRARFLKIVAGAIGGATGAYVLYEMAPWTNGKAAAERVRRPLHLVALGVPLIRELVRYATLAASGHNTQPWKFIVKDHVIQIHPDTSRRLPAVDPNDRELWISLGCALENLSIAARRAGYEPEITYPEKNDWIEVHLAPRKPEDGPLFAPITARQNTRSLYDGLKLGGSEVAQVMSIPAEAGITLRLFEGHTDTEKVLEYVSMGNQSQFNDKAFIGELVHWIRFDKREATASMDGLYSLCTGNPQVPRWIGQQVLGHMAPQTQVDADAKKLRSSAGLIAVTSASDSKTAWVRTGQVYERLALKMTLMNIKSAFLNQPNEVPAVRKQFQAALGFGEALPQLLLRFGRADAMPSSFRRPVDDVITWS